MDHSEIPARGDTQERVGGQITMVLGIVQAPEVVKEQPTEFQRVPSHIPIWKKVWNSYRQKSVYVTKNGVYRMTMETIAFDISLKGTSLLDDDSKKS